MSDLLNRLREHRRAVYNDADKFLSDVERRGESLTGAIETRWRQFQTELAGLDERIAELTEVEAREAQAAPIRARFAAFTPATSEGDDAVLRSFLSGERQSIDIDLTGVRRHLDRDGRWSVVESRDLVTTTPTAGGNVVPSSFRSQLVEHMVASSAIRQTNVTVLTTPTGDELTIPRTTAHSTATITPEATQIDESDPAFATTVLGAYKYGVRMEVSTELLTDTGIDLRGYLARQAGEALGNASGAHFITGNGTTEPQGITGVTTLGKSGATGVGGVFTGDDLIDLFFSVIPRYRANGYWLMNDATAAAVRKLKDPGGDHYLWERSLVAGTPDRILGRPVVIDPNMPDIAAGAKSVLFGDFSRYFIRDVAGVRFEASTEHAFDRDMVVFRALLRTDGDLADLTGAVKHFAGGAAE